MTPEDQQQHSEQQKLWQLEFQKQRLLLQSGTPKPGQQQQQQEHHPGIFTEVTSVVGGVRDRTTFFDAIVSPVHDPEALKLGLPPGP
jgi:hypothetical protein